MTMEDNVKALSYLLDMRKRVAQGANSDLEYSNGMTAVIFEEALSQYMEKFGNKLMEITIEGKKYICIAMGEWNIEKPFIGWASGKNESLKLFYGEDGKVYDDLHGQMDMSFKIRTGTSGIEPQESTTSRLITVAPERRQRLVTAYQSYMKKKKK